MVKKTCRFCGLVHEPCDATYCYCGDSPSAVKGEGYDVECTAFWGDGAWHPEDAEVPK